MQHDLSKLGNYTRHLGVRSTKYHVSIHLDAADDEAFADAMGWGQAAFHADRWTLFSVEELTTLQRHLNGAYYRIFADERIKLLGEVGIELTRRTQGVHSSPSEVWQQPEDRQA